MVFRDFRRAGLAIGLVLLAATAPQTAAARVFGLGGKPAISAGDAVQIADIRRALDEQRLIDAGSMIDAATASGSKDPQLRILSGELGLQRARYDAALEDFKAAESAPGAWEALQGEGIALAYLGRTDDSIAALQKAVAQAPGAWRAWNALGSQYDQRRDWPRATEAYAQALSASKGSPLVLNNRGYSMLLQGRTGEAIPDFVAALEKKPDLAEARANLRLAMALKGDYSRSISGGDRDSRAALLNNAGFAAGVRGDYDKAEDLLQEALQARGEFYDRAAENLKVIHTLEAQRQAGTNDRN